MAPPTASTGDDPDESERTTEVAVADETGTVDVDPVQGLLDDVDHVVVVGYDAWTEPVLVELGDHDVSFSVITTNHAAADRLADRGLTVVDVDDVDEACFHEAGIDRAEAVLVATLDDQLNVLAVLTVMNVDDSMRVVTFAGEAQDVSKLRSAGADHVVSLGQSVGELLVEVALSERDIADVVSELVEDPY